MTYDGATMQYWQDGIPQPVPRDTGVKMGMLPPTAAVTIGNEFVGLIDGVRIYKEALAPYQIMALYNAPNVDLSTVVKPAPMCSGLEADYSFEGDAFDASGNYRQARSDKGTLMYRPGLNGGKAAFFPSGGSTATCSPQVTDPKRGHGTRRPSSS